MTCSDLWNVDIVICCCTGKGDLSETDKMERAALSDTGVLMEAKDATQREEGRVSGPDCNRLYVTADLSGRCN